MSNTSRRPPVGFDFPYKGALVLGRYILEERIGSGGYGEIWLARDAYDPDAPWVAIKFLRADACDDENRRRFASEIKSLEEVREHPNIVLLHEHGEELGLPFFVMEYIPGVPLRSLLDQHRRDGTKPEFNEVRHIFIQVCRAIQYAHRKNITHRDIKPENIMLMRDADGRWLVKLVDFGVARIGERVLTQNGQPIGTFGYIAPEQLAGDQEKVGPKSDVYALGILLIEMLTTNKKGVPVFSSKYPHVRENLLPGEYTRRQRQDVPHELWEVIARSLEDDHLRRYEDAEDLLEAFIITLSQATTLRQLSRLQTPVLQQRRATTLPAVPAISNRSNATAVTPKLRRSERPGWRSQIMKALRSLWPNKRYGNTKL